MEIKNITIFGSGLIGSGWTTHFLIKNQVNVTMYDINEVALAKGKTILEKNMDFLLQENVFTESQKTELLAGIRYTTDSKCAVKNADLIIENGPEILELKQSIIKEIEENAKTDAIITSSTSGLLIEDIAKNSSHPERIFGCHPYHPVYLLPLIEISKMSCSDEEKLDTLLNFFMGIDKKPVVLKKMSDGYIGSHLMTALLRESINLVTSGICDIKDIDDAFLYGPGMRYGLLGIFTTLQLGGGDGGFTGMMCGPIGQSTGKWLQSYADWKSWPKEAQDLFENAQPEIDEMLSKRDSYHGRNNEEMEIFRDKGLVQILKAHHMI